MSGLAADDTGAASNNSCIRGGSKIFSLQVQRPVRKFGFIRIWFRIVALGLEGLGHILAFITVGEPTLLSRKSALPLSLECK